MHPKLPQDILDHARSLRINQTDAEKLLWMLLRNRQLEGYKFRRQHEIGPFVVDFYCAEGRLIVELDGGQHNEDEAAVKDEGRTRYLEARGDKLVRFWNHKVLRSTEAVLETIYGSLVERADALTPAPLPEEEGILRGDKAGNKRITCTSAGYTRMRLSGRSTTAG